MSDTHADTKRGWTETVGLVAFIAGALFCRLVLWFVPPTKPNPRFGDEVVIIDGEFEGMRGIVNGRVNANQLSIEPKEPE